MREPPKTFTETLRYLGPGFVLSAAIVGSGELIATTTLGAKAGFVTFWVIIVSCLVKVALQLEFGKHAIHSGESTMYSLNQLPGPRFGKAKANWSLWVWLFIQLFKFLQVGGIVGGVAIILNIIFPAITITFWAIIVTVITSLLVYKGYYTIVEKASLVMIGIFTIFTLASLFFLQYTSYAITWPQLQEGLSFRLPPATVAVAVAAFGITGVGGDEIMYYNYWCLEKGYAAYTGSYQNTPEWEHRARGWIKVMYIDALFAMVVYTSVTAAFYLLGAAVLHAKGSIPEGYAMVETLSQMYTETLGSWARSIFLAGAFVVLYSTLFAAAAAWIRIFSDNFGQMGWINFYNPGTRKKVMAWLAWIFPATWTILFLFIQLPVLMILIGGFVTSILLLVVVYAAIHFRYHRLPANLYPGKWYDATFWLSAVVIVLTALYGIFQVF
ncbi:divalent metal cation transporter [Rhodocytophaga rosea]|uniref:Divalent metal cation transporter n=1 Tax=Rhodocytophaga rosea TaxID=2704465 RepID=A0A6C0GV01_9BACT|nr:divalent metal cation transporter [Rhodocytophaga rosea]